MVNLESNRSSEGSSLLIMLRKLAPYIFVFFLPLLVYSPSLHFSFVYDDAELIVRKTAPDSAASWGHLLLSPYFYGLPYYRPIPALLFGLERLAFGLNPCPYRCTNLLLIGLLSLAIFDLFRTPFFRFSSTQSIVLTLLAVLHPVMSSAVYLLSGREALLAALFAVYAIRRLIKLRGRLDWIGCLWMVLALLSRESSIWLIPLMAVLLILNRTNVPRYQLITNVTRLSLLGIAYGALRFVALSGHAPSPSLNPDLLLIPASFLYALKGILMPTLSVQYEPPLSQWFTVEFLVLVVLILTLFAGVSRYVGVFRDRTGQSLLAALCLSLLPTANIFIQETPFDERHLVLPLIVATALFGWIITRLLDFKAIRSHVLLVIVSTTLAIVSFSRRTVFLSDEAFLNHWYLNAPEQAKVNVYQIIRSLVANDWQQAMQYANRSIELQENNLALLYRARVNLMLGDVTLAQQDLENSALIDNQNTDVLCERMLLARMLADTEKASILLKEAQRKSEPLWCLTSAERGMSPSYWTEGLNLSEDELQKLPLFNREEWRRVQNLMK